jgi:hypothetical protein
VINNETSTVVDWYRQQEAASKERIHCRPSPEPYQPGGEFTSVATSGQSRVLHAAPLHVTWKDFQCEIVQPMVGRHQTAGETQEERSQIRNALKRIRRLRRSP